MPGDGSGSKKKAPGLGRLGGDLPKPAGHPSGPGKSRRVLVCFCRSCPYESRVTNLPGSVAVAPDRVGPGFTGQAFQGPSDVRFTVNAYCKVRAKSRKHPAKNRRARVRCKRQMDLRSATIISLTIASRGGRQEMPNGASQAAAHLCNCGSPVPSPQAQPLKANACGESRRNLTWEIKQAGCVVANAPRCYFLPNCRVSALARTEGD